MEIITETNALAEACKHLATSDYVTVDTEFMRESTFWPELCLIQVAHDTFECLIDPLAPAIDLEPFFELMTNESITKVFHSARQDIEIVYSLSGGRLPRPVFDTQVAAMVCGFGESVSYANLVESLLGHTLDKGQRFTDWRRRPLSRNQQIYALNDVTYLRDIYKILKKKLEETGRASWLDEEMDILTSVSTYEQHPEDAWKRLKMKVKKPESIAVLIELAKWREERAQSRNVPRGRIMKDDAIYDIAGQLPRNDRELERLRTMGKNIVGSPRAREILRLVRLGQQRDKSRLPVIAQKRKPSQEVLATTELLKVLLKAVAAREQVASRVIANAADLEAIAANDKAPVRALSGWRLELFGKEALKLKRGEIAMTVSNGQIITIDAPKRTKS